MYFSYTKQFNMNFSRCLITLIILSSILACNTKTSTNENDNLFTFKEYVSYNTNNLISITNPISIVFSKPLEQFELRQEVALEYLKIFPKTQGSLVVENGNTLVFQPSDYLKPNTTYSVTVALDKLYEDVPKKFSSYTFSFKTIQPNYKIDLGGLQSHSKKWQYLEGTLEVSDLITIEDAKEILKASQEDKNLPITWPTETKDAAYFNFTIDSIHRKVEDSEIRVSWDGNAIQSKNAGENTKLIPGQNNFTVLDVKHTAAPRTSLAINFSDPINENQNFNGLVALGDTQNLRFEVDGNILRVYPPNRITGNISVTVFNGIENSVGYKLKKEFSELVSFEELAPSVRLLSKGVILPNAAATPLYFEAVNLSAVDIRIIQIFESNMLQFLQGSNLDNSNSYSIKHVGRRVAKKTITLLENKRDNDGLWKAHGINLTDFFKTDPGAMYRIEISFKKEYIAYDCSKNRSKTSLHEEDEYYDNYGNDTYISSGDEDEESREKRYWDNELYSWRNNNYNWQQRDNPCHEAYYNNDRIITTNVLGSNLGLIIKKDANKSYHFITNNLLSSMPEKNVKIKLYNYQQQLVETITTNTDGFSIYDSDKTIAFAVAEKNNNFAYLKLNDGNALSLSNFDVSGAQLQKGIKGFMYTERGVYRPGDDIHLSFVLNDNANPLPTNHPVKLEVTDARGKLVQQTVAIDNINGFYYFPINTSADAPTGNWNALIKVGGVQFSKSLKIATIKPNRLKIKLDFEDEILEAKKPIKGSVKGLWLHGSPARNLKIEMEATLRSTSTAFPKFDNYIFNDPVRKFNEVEIPLLKTKLSSKGLVTLNKKLDLNQKAPGMLKASFLTKIFEGGGDFSMDVFSRNLAPYSHFVGLKSPKAKRYGSFFTDENTVFDVASVDAQGNAVGNRELEVKVFRIEWRWWWNRGRDNLSRYENASVHRPVNEFKVTTKGNGKTNFTLKIPDNEGGRYLIRVIDTKSGHATGRVTYFYRNWSKAPSDGNSESAKMLVFSSNKEKYEVGEEAEIRFPSGSAGRALLSVENGTKVLLNQWIETRKGETSTKIRITKEMAPNVYVNISLLQMHEQTKNDLPMRLYGVIPILVENPETILTPQLAMPEAIKPEEKFTVKVSEKTGKEMTYTIAVVDEGLLDLSRFKTPKIHEAFYTREALGVRTFDMYDYVIGAHSGSVNNIYAIGGGEEVAGVKNRKADRFKPVVQYLGPFILPPGTTKSHKITMPNYIGSVRTMLIAGNNVKSAYGKTDKTTPVRKPLMVLASLPRKLSPGEIVTLPVTVFAMDKKVKSAVITVKVSEALKPINGLSKTISFPEVGEQIVNFNFEVLPSTTAQNIEVVATGHGEKASYKVAINVENPNPISQKTTQFVLSKNENQTIKFSTFGVTGTNTAMLEFSTLPPMDFGKRLAYLIQYPHGCIEQTTSGAFPQLYLADVFDLNFAKTQEIENNIKAAIKRINTFQGTDGGLSYWPGERESDQWGSNYAGHFMLEAKQKGYALPIAFMSNWLRYQKSEARQWRKSNSSGNSDITQSYRLYTLALAGQPELASMNRLRESKNLSNDAIWRLAAAYALAGKKKVAGELTKIANINFTPNKYDYQTYGSPFRNKAMALETMVATGDDRQREIAVSLAKELSSQRWYSTQETAYGLLAMAKMIDNNGGKGLDITFTKNGKNTTLKTNHSMAQRDLSVAMDQNSVRIFNNLDNIVYVTLTQNGKLPLGNELSDQKNLRITSQYLDGENKPLDISALRQGTDIKAKVTVTNTSNDWIGNLALSKIFPSGWEIVNTSFTELGGGAKGKARYIDIRDDRVNFYFDLKSKASKTFTVKLNTSYLGKYYLPGTQVEAMYDNTYYARNSGLWVSVEE